MLAAASKIGTDNREAEARRRRDSNPAASIRAAAFSGQVDCTDCLGEGAAGKMQRALPEATSHAT